MTFNYIFLRAIVFPLIYDNYGNNGNIYILLIIAVLILLFLLLPKAFYRTDFNSKYNDSKIKWIINPILILRVVIGVATSILALQRIFYFDYSYIPIIFGIILAIAFISSLKSNEVIQISTLFSIAIILGYLLFLFNYIDIDFNLLLKDFRFSGSWILVLMVLCLFLDNLNILISNKEGINLSKGLFILALLSSFVLFSFEYGMLVLTSGDELFRNDNLVGFQALSIEPVSRHNGNFDFVYILMIAVASIFKFSYFMSIIKDSINFKFNRKHYICLYVVLFLLIFGAIKLLILDEVVAMYSVIGLFLIGAIMLIWMIRVIINAKKIQG